MPTVNKVSFSPELKKIIYQAYAEALMANSPLVEPGHFLLAVNDRLPVPLAISKLRQLVGANLPAGPAKTDGTSVLDQFSQNLTKAARAGKLDAVIGRTKEIDQVIRILARRSKSNAILIGDPGVGKTAIVEGLALKISQGDVPELLKQVQIYNLNLTNLLAGASYQGELEERLNQIVKEVKKMGQTIVFIDEIHMIVGAGAAAGAMTAANILKPALARGDLNVIGATTLDEFRQYIEKDPALERRFQPVLVPEPTEEEAIKMLQAIKDKYEAFHKVKIPQEAIETAVKLSKRYVGDRFLPDKAVDLIDEAAAAVRLPLISLPEEIKSLETRVAQLNQELGETEKRHDQVKTRILRSKINEINSQLKEKKDEYNLKKAQTTTSINPEIIRDIISRWTGIPISKITSSEVERLAHLEEIIHKKLINQEAAVSSVSQAIRRGRAGLKSETRPIGSFIFLGPTGVGKTELAKTLADVLFGTEEAMIRFDMTEYMERHEVAKLLGAPPGYVGYEEGGKLTESVRRRPYSVVLFDEIEKAHPDIFNILLQILDDGRLTDNKGHVISFKNSVVICTSNIGTKMIQEEMLKDKSKIPNPKSQINPKSKIQNKTKEKTEKYKDNFQDIREKVMAELVKFFRPELVNRFDEVTVFEPLSFQNMAEIVKLQLKGVGKLLEDQEIGFFYADEVVEEIVQAGFDPIYGARPLKRAIQRLIENPISNFIIEGKIKPGDQLKVKVVKDELVFDIEKTTMVTVPTCKYHCLTCGYRFENEVVKNSTVICPKCLSRKLEEVK